MGCPANPPVFLPGDGGWSQPYLLLLNPDEQVSLFPSENISLSNLWRHYGVPPKSHVLHVAIHKCSSSESNRSGCHLESKFKSQPNGSRRAKHVCFPTIVLRYQHGFVRWELPSTCTLVLIVLLFVGESSVSPEENSGQISSWLPVDDTERCAKPCQHNQCR